MTKMISAKEASALTRKGDISTPVIWFNNAIKEAAKAAKSEIIISIELWRDITHTHEDAIKDIMISEGYVIEYFYKKSYIGLPPYSRRNKMVRISWQAIPVKFRDFEGF